MAYRFEDLDDAEVDLPALHIDTHHLHGDLIAQTKHLLRILAAQDVLGEPLTFKSYDSDHSGTLLPSQRDTHPFVRRLFAR